MITNFRSLPGRFLNSFVKTRSFLSLLNDTNCRLRLCSLDLMTRIFLRVPIRSVPIYVTTFYYGKFYAIVAKDKHRYALVVR
jgi:hypothetical protein